jgi:hypothetical protein
LKASRPCIERGGFYDTGDRARADEHLQTALTMYREMGMGFWLEKAEAALGSPPRDSA